MNQDYIIANNLTLLDGRFISQSDMDNARGVAVVSDKFVNNLFPNGADPIGQLVKIFKSNTIELYTIIGVYKYEAGVMGMNFQTASDQDLSTGFYIPDTTAKIDSLSKNYQNITVVASGGTDVIDFSATLDKYFSEIYKNNAAWQANVSNMESQIETIMSTLGTISMAIAFIAGISLLVGGIGIMNIMLVSVTERTREIGTRKALGAKNFHIRLQFVSESIVISGIGGFIGIVLGTTIGAVISSFLNAPVTLSTTVIAVSVLFSMVIGVFFGYYPANKAAKLDPIEALRYE